MPRIAPFAGVREMNEESGGDGGRKETPDTEAGSFTGRSC